jgi:5-methylcytosine-specific restriction endonuclease McrA
MTVSSEVREKLRRALDALLTKLEKQSRGGVAREVYARDGERCTFVSDDGLRCEETGFLELDHVTPKARGGTEDAGNLRVRCRAHNQHYADETYGREYMERRKLAERAVGALVHMGFSAKPARAAIDQLTADRQTSPPIEELVRRAVGVLTPDLSARLGGWSQDDRRSRRCRCGRGQGWVAR